VIGELLDSELLSCCRRDVQVSRFSGALQRGEETALLYETAAAEREARRDGESRQPSSSELQRSTAPFDSAAEERADMFLLPRSRRSSPPAPFFAIARSSLSKMAVIQDLPPELLRQILELTLDPYAEFRDAYKYADRFKAAPSERQLILCRAALVARAWLAPAVGLMTHELVLSMHCYRPQTVLAHLQSQGAVDAAIVQRLQVLVPVAESLTVLGNAVRGLASLNIFGNIMYVQSLPPKLLISEHLSSLRVSPCVCAR
jgi:hypothetical protein